MDLICNTDFILFAWKKCLSIPERKMNTLGFGSELDAAEALLELQRDNRESNTKLPMATFLYNLIGPRSSLSAVPTSTSTPKTSPSVTIKGKSEPNSPFGSQNDKHHELHKSSDALGRPYRDVTNNNTKCKVKKEAVITKVWADSMSDNSFKINKQTTHDKATQTEIEYQMPEIEKMETVIRGLCSKIKSLENRIKNKRFESSSLIDSITDLNSDISNDDQCIQGKSNFNGRRSHKRKRTSTVNTDHAEYNSNSANTTHMDLSSNDSDLDKDNSNSSKILKPNPMKIKNEMVSIGDGNAIVPSKLMKNMDWTSYTNATRKLLTAVFSRKVLATHSLTGKPSPAFPDKPAKKKLNSSLVNDIVQTVVEKCHVPESVVRTSITTKCADESKMFRSRQQSKKKRISNKRNRENFPPFKYDSDDSDESYLSS